MDSRDRSSQPFLSQGEADAKTREAQRKRLEQAKAIMVDYNASEAKSRKKGKAAAKKAEKGSARREKTVIEQLKEDPGTPKERVRRYQDDPGEVAKLTQRIRALYENMEEKRPSRTRYLTGEIVIELFECSSGWTVLNGNVFGCGENPRRRDELERVTERMAAVREDDGTGGVEESDVVEHIETTTEAWQKCVDVCDDKDLESFWAESSLVGQEGKRKWKRDSIKAIRMRVAMRGEQCPYLPIQKPHYDVLRYAYSHDLFRTVSWKTPLNTKEREDATYQLEQQYGIGVSSVTKLMLEDYMSRSTAQKTVNTIQGKGMTTQEEMMLIRELIRLSVAGSSLDARIMREIPHSIATIESQHGLYEGCVGEVVVGVEVVLGNAIDCFLAGVHRLYIDACFSSDGWNILLACFLDANHHIQPVGFRLGQSESYADWFLFLRQLHDSGLHAASDLVIYSDRSAAIRGAVERVFPQCEHTPCSVHIERNIQDKWSHVYPPLRKDNELGITVLNAMIECYNNACIAIDELECNGWIE